MPKSLLPADFPITSSMRVWAAAKVPQVDIEEQHEQFCDYWRAHGKKMADWEATWRNWMRRSPEFARPVTQFSRLSTVRAPSQEPPRKIAPPIMVRDHPLFRKPQ
jgi:hypothetical protein